MFLYYIIKIYRGEIVKMKMSDKYNFNYIYNIILLFTL